MSGTGKMVFKDVGVYNGTYSNSLREGNGTFTWNNGDKYDGEWENDVRDGLQTVQEGRRAVLVLPGTLFCHACVSKADHTRNRRDP